MSGGYVSNAATYLVTVLFGFYIGAVMLRFLLQWVRADFYYNPIARALVAITNPALRPLRRIIPGYKGIDWAALTLMFAVQLAESTLILLILGRAPSFPALLVIAAADLASLAVWLFFAAVFIQIILSWVSPDQYNPLMELIEPLTEPLMKPARQILPPIGGLDLSPILVILFLQLTSMLLIAPIKDLGYGLL